MKYALKHSSFTNFKFYGSLKDGLKTCLMLYRQIRQGKGGEAKKL